MTLFAVTCAGMFPLLHLGRPWVFYFLDLPYPDTMALWPQFRSPLVWDVFAVSTYFTVSLDLLVHRDRCRTWRRCATRRGPMETDRLRRCWRWVGAGRPFTGSGTNRPTCSWRVWPRRWCSRCTAW